MARATLTIEPFEDVTFLHRPPPAQGTDLILYVEEQIAELLFSEETLDEVLYRFMETDDGVLVAIARKKTIERKPLPPEKPGIRLPSAMVLWLRARAGLKPDEKALLYLPEGDHAWLLCADALQVHRVYRVRTGQENRGEFVLALDKLADASRSRTLFHTGPVSDAMRKELDGRAISRVPLTLAPVPSPDYSIIAGWDFRLPSEISGHELRTWRLRVIKAGMFAAAGIALGWCLLYGGNRLLERTEKRMAKTWAALRSSLKEVTYIQKETRGLIVEINLCRTLADRRTNRASVLQEIAQSRPAADMLERLRIGEKKKRFVKGQAPVVPEETLLVEGFSSDPRGITAWMDALLKSGAFVSVNLLSIERKGADYRYQIECDLPVR